MAHYTFTARNRRPAAFGFLLRLRVEAQPAQRTLFHGADGLSVQQLTSELAETVARLRVVGFDLRYRLEQATVALQTNVSSGFWPQAQAAAVELASLLTHARTRGVSSTELTVRCADAAHRIAELCGQEVR